MRKRKQQMERALAHIEKVEWVKPIEGADNIELIGVLGWICVAKKGEFHAGDRAVYIEIDSRCPQDDERFAFLASKNYKIKTMKLSKFNVISQGLALPISLFPELEHKKAGTDVTELLKITYSSQEDLKRKSNKVDPDSKCKIIVGRHPKLFKLPMMRKLMEHSSGKKLVLFLFGRKIEDLLEFPNWIVRTDEVRIENAIFHLQSTDKWIKTEKLDGCSCTYAVDKLHRKNDFEFIVCSRNIRQSDKKERTDSEENIYWELAEKYDIEHILKEFAETNCFDRVVLQGEGVGPLIQGNPYKLEENRLFCFNLVINGKRTSTQELVKFCEENHLEHVPIVETECELCHTMEEMKAEADGFSLLNPAVLREGFVYRSKDGKQRFKNVSREYLLKHNG